MKSSYSISSFASISITGSLLATSSSCFLASSAAFFSSTFSNTSFKSSLANKISGFSTTFVPDTYLPYSFMSSNSLLDALSCAKIFAEVSGINGSNKLAPTEMLSTKL